MTRMPQLGSTSKDTMLPVVSLAPFAHSGGGNPPCPLPERVRDKFRKGGIYTPHPSAGSGQALISPARGERVGAVIPLRGHKILCPYNRGRSTCSDLPVLYERGIGRGHLAPTEYGHAFDSRKCKGALQCAPTQVGVRLWRTTEESLIVAQG